MIMSNCILLYYFIPDNDFWEKYDYFILYIMKLYLNTVEKLFGPEASDHSANTLNFYNILIE